MRTRMGFAVRVLAGAVAGLVTGISLTRLPMEFRAGREPRLAITSAAVSPTAPSNGRIFMSDAGIMIKFIKQEKASDFEGTVVRLKEALERSNNPQRRLQGTGWKVFRAIEPATNGDAVYVFEIDPAVKGADYAVARILEEAYPAEAPSLYRRYAESYSAGQNIVELRLIAAFGK